MVREIEMVGEHSLGDVIKGSYDELEPFFRDPGQSVYLYPDHVHEVCSDHFASPLDYDSAEESAAVDADFPIPLVQEGSQMTLVSACRQAVGDSVASVIEDNWRSKDGGTVQTSVLLAPFERQGH